MPKTYADLAHAHDAAEPDTSRWPARRPKPRKPRTCSLCGRLLDLAEYAVCDGCRETTEESQCRP
jgi:hypothetical protein